MKIGRFIETQERRVDGLSARETILQRRLQEKEKKIAAAEKNIAKTRKEQTLILQAANNERMNKGKEKMAEESSKIQYEANNHYSKMIIDREDMIKSRH